MITCPEMVELASEVADGRLTGWQRLQAKIHLGYCRGCRRYLEQIRTVAAIGRQLSESTPSDETEALLSHVRRPR